MNHFGRLLRLSLFTLSLYVIYLIRNEILFEKFLGSSYISFDDFPPSYAKALNDSVSTGTEVKFDYALFSKSNNLSSYPSKIPRIIHFIWFKNLYEDHDGTSDIPSQGSNTPDLCRKHNPDFEINIWNTTAARDFLETEYAWFLPTYDAYSHPIQRVDALKYFLLWHYGGVYMDLDISCRRALDPLLTFPAWFPRASPLGVNNDLMATVPRHPMMGRLTANLQSRNKWLISPYLTVFWSTGPKYTSDMLMAWFREEIQGGSVVRASSKIDAGNDEFFILPQIFYSEQYSFFGHRPGGTWHGQDVVIVLWFAERLWILPLIGFIFLCALVVASKRRNIHAVLSYSPRFSFTRAPEALPSLPLFSVQPRKRPWM